VPVRAGAIAAVLGLAALSFTACAASEESRSTGRALVDRGDELFHGEATCALCHGAELTGTAMGPPLLHEIYRPDHHPDRAIRLAVRNGVQPHHWSFGPMPKLPHVSDSDIDALIAYVRAEQQRAGIE
jgi:mono/diheme cytochrome c family protein